MPQKRYYNKNLWPTTKWKSIQLYYLALYKMCSVKNTRQVAFFKSNFFAQLKKGLRNRIYRMVETHLYQARRSYFIQTGCIKDQLWSTAASRRYNSHHNARKIGQHTHRCYFAMWNHKVFDISIENPYIMSQAAIYTTKQVVNCQRNTNTHSVKWSAHHHSQVSVWINPRRDSVCNHAKMLAKRRETKNINRSLGSLTQRYIARRKNQTKRKEKGGSQRRWEMKAISKKVNTNSLNQERNIVWDLYGTRLSWSRTERVSLSSTVIFESQRR